LFESLEGEEGKGRKRGL